MSFPDPPAHLYITGPMTGYPDLNRKAFAECQDWLEQEGFTVFNPSLGSEPDRQLAESNTETAHEQRQGQPYKDGMRRNIARIASVGTGYNEPIRGMVLLPGWWDSPGARFDTLVAQQIGLPMLEWGVAYSGNNRPLLTEPQSRVVTEAKGPTRSIMPSFTHVHHLRPAVHADDTA